ncbi:DUF1799 domain-containing protein [Delftia sp. PS-11]|uniref:DUF1799 domain-containing protein n=1 Tax=Delftia sp. PS-11 TaxID=2767222 RepID=UPI0024548FD3|nr:DUF1799 domain-containing protein [Delftia sp. PS-11]KAJ8745432.1 DUF1799 domain-containing protein [Delftia sp. PS-11]
MLEAMQAMGAPAQDIERVAAAIEAQRAILEKPPETFGVWAENWDVVMAWLDVQTQWRIVPVPMGLDGSKLVHVGLDYAGVAAWLDLFAQQRKRREIMAGLQMMERAALSALHEIRQQQERG